MLDFTFQTARQLLCAPGASARIGELGLGEKVRLCGHAEDMPAALMLADVVVHASTDPEAFGRTVIEAQAMARALSALESVTLWPQRQALGGGG